MAELAVTWFGGIVVTVFVVKVALHLDVPVKRSTELRERNADEMEWHPCDQCVKVPVEGLRRDELVLEDVVGEGDLDVVLVVITAVMSVEGIV